ncbi:hypothetical protein E2C01_045404 [Portunus trituberculatus]|uniref:Uncharacterized protein n=1 Tax=Portunus trituberculatus TaxID=210409 RepID=A0A5B7G1X8_PORTR|nr:hypothetical protein [Portunus trituberculatus]
MTLLDIFFSLNFYLPLHTHQHIFATFFPSQSSKYPHNFYTFVTFLNSQSSEYPHTNFYTFLISLPSYQPSTHILISLIPATLA